MTATEIRRSGIDLYPRVFSPFEIRNVRLRNRIVRTSQGSGLTAGGLITEESIAWHVARARGGVALGYSDPGQTHWSSPAFIDNTSDASIDGMRALTAAVHAEGMQMFEQLMHGGPTNIPLDGSAPWAASAIPDPGLGMVSRPMTQWMIDEVVAGFAGAARRAQLGGMDGVEVHGGHGYLFSAFLSSATNHRTDGYGGSFDNRVRLLREVLAAIRSEVGAEYVVGVRLSADGSAGHADGASVLEVALDLEARGLIDFVNLSLGSHYGRDLLMGGLHENPGYQLKVNADIARRISLPTIVTGRLASIADAEQALADGSADLVGMVRATIADPEIVKKTAEGRTGEIRPCIACNQSCAGGLNTRGRVSCTVNAVAGRELRYGDDSLRSAAPGRLVVVGGGPCGVEAARAGALAGHEVILLESGEELGGQLRFVRASPHRAEVAALLPYYAASLAALDVDVRLGVSASAASIAELAPDSVVVATGSRPRRDGFQTLRPWGPPAGFDPAAVLTSWDVLGGAETTGAVVLLDEVGHYETLDVAQLLVSQGRSVRLVTRFSAVAANLEMRWEMIGGPNARMLFEGDFELCARRVITEITPTQVRTARIEAPQRQDLIDYDTLVFISGNVPSAELYEELRDGPWSVRVAGDAVGPRLLEAATFEGNLAVRSLEAGWVRPAVRFGQTGSAI